MGGLGIPIIDEKHRLYVRDEVFSDFRMVACDVTNYVLIGSVCKRLPRGIPKDTQGTPADFSGFPLLGNVYEIIFEKGTRWNVVDGWVK